MLHRNCPSKLLAHLASLILWEVRFCISKDDVDGAVNRDVKGDSNKHSLLLCLIFNDIPFIGYEPVKLMQLVTSKINNVCFEFLNNQKFESLCTELSFSNRPLHPVSVHAIRNGRRKMEDRHVVIQDLNTICSIRVNKKTMTSSKEKVISVNICFDRMIYPQATMPYSMVMQEQTRHFTRLLSFTKNWFPIRNSPRNQVKP